MNTFFKTIKSLLSTTNEAVTDDAKITSEEVALLGSYDSIPQLVGEGNTKEALQQLIQLHGKDNYDLQFLQERFDRNEEQYKSKRIDFKEYNITLAQINNALLQTLPQSDKKTATISPDVIHKLLSKDKIKETLALLVQADYEGVILLQAGFNVAQKAFADKRITEETRQLEKNRTIISILNIVDKGAVDKADAPLSLKETIRDLVARAQLEKALDLLIQTGNEEAQLLKTRLINAQQQARIGRSSHSDFSAINNEIMDDILNIIEPPVQKDNSKSNKIESPIEQTLVNRTTVQELISNGKTEQVFILLQQSGYPEAAALYEKFKAHKRHLHLGLLQESTWAAFQKELYEEILTWQYVEETTPKKMLSATDKLHIQQLLQSNKTEKALHFCKGFGNPYFILLFSYNQIINNSKFGLITEADKQQQLEAINAALRHLIA